MRYTIAADQVPVDDATPLDALLPIVLRDLSKKGYSLQATPSATLLSKDQVSLLSNTFHLKLLSAKKEGHFQYNPDITVVRHKVYFIPLLKQDPLLSAMILDENYAFSEKQLTKISQSDYRLIKNQPISCIFLLAGFSVTELDPPAMNKTIAWTADFNDHHIRQLIELAESTKRHIGLDNFRQLLTQVYTNTAFDLHKLPTVLNAANSMGKKAPITFNAFLALLRDSSDWALISNALPDLYCRAIDESCAPVPDEDVYASYTQESDDVLRIFMPEQPALNASILNFQALQKQGKTLLGLTEDELKHALDKAVKSYKSAVQPQVKQSDEAMIWAILREQFRLTYHIFLHSTQMINAHLILNSPNQKTIAQIKTGEGKSALLTVMMAFRALTTNKKQFNVTTSNGLAERDVVKFTPFYKKCGLSCTTNVSSDPKKGSLHGVPNSYAGHIVYGTASAFQFGYMQSLYPKSPLSGIIQPEITDIYIDEVDALVIDQEKSMSYIKGKAGVDRAGVFHDIWDYIWQNRSIDGRPATDTLDDFGHYLINKGHFTHITINMKDNAYLVSVWYNSAQRAMRLERELDYVIKPRPENPAKKCVVIVDRYGTSELMYGLTWFGGLHQIISAREGVHAQSEAPLQACISHSVFFNLFENMFAVTGTIGGVSCQAYLTTVYPGVSIMNMPRYRASQAVRTHDVLSENKSHHYDQLIMDIVQARAKGQPLLLLFSTIRETMEFQAHALSLGHEVSTLTGHEEASMDDIFALAGLPGSILAATFLAGRGADIATTPEAEQNGGLGVLVCNPPENERVIWQNFGRTGRQGRHGFFAFRFNQVDLLLAINAINNKIEYNDYWCKQPEASADNIDSLNIVLPSKHVHQWETLQQEPVVALPQEAIEVREEKTHKVMTTLKQDNETKKASLAAETKKELKRPETKYIELWENKREESNRLENSLSAHHACYSRVVFALQTFVYDYAKHEKSKHFMSLLSHRYRLVMADLHYFFHAKALVAFEKYIGDTLLELGEINGIPSASLQDFAEQTRNDIMMRCIMRARPSASAAVSSTNSNTFFSSNAVKNKAASDDDSELDEDYWSDASDSDGDDRATFKK